MTENLCAALAILIINAEELILAGERIVNEPPDGSPNSDLIISLPVPMSALEEMTQLSVKSAVQSLLIAGGMHEAPAWDSSEP